MKKGVLIGLVVVVIVLIVLGVYYFLGWGNKINFYCRGTSCAPYKDFCNEWRSIAYPPYKECHYSILDLIELNDIGECKKIRRKDLATYCIALVLANNPELKFDLESFAGDDKELQAISHITGRDQLLETIRDEQVLNSIANRTATQLSDSAIGKYVVLGSCEGRAYSQSCTSLIWIEGGETTQELQHCTGGSYSKDCSEGYYCYQHLTGGMGPEGPLPVEPYGGDGKCHKLCSLDSDCPEETPYCLGKEIQVEDMATYEYLCFDE